MYNEYSKRRTRRKMTNSSINNKNITDIISNMK